MIKKIGIGVGVLIILGVAYYGISPIFIHTRVDEAAPESKGEAMRDSDTKTSPSLVQQNAIPSAAPTGSPIMGTVGHPASGTVRVVKTEDGDVVRYENFKTLNGPDLYVYLSKDLEAKEYVSLGALKATEGNVNYQVPRGIATEDYRYALVWCKQFGVLFNYAELDR